MQEIKFVSPELVEAFFKKVKSIRDRALFTMIYFYGMHSSEIGLMQVEDLDFQNNRILIHAKKHGITAQHLLHPQVKKYLRIYLDEERFHKRTLEKALFLSQKGGPLTSTQVFRLFREYARKAKFPVDKRHCHVFRHSIAVHFDRYPLK